MAISLERTLILTRYILQFPKIWLCLFLFFLLLFPFIYRSSNRLSYTIFLLNHDNFRRDSFANTRTIRPWTQKREPLTRISNFHHSAQNMTGTPNCTSPAGEAITPFDGSNNGRALTAPPMSISSSMSSNVSDMWSSEPSRRCSDASSVGGAEDLHSALFAEKLKASLAAGSVPMAVSASEDGQMAPAPAPAPARRPFQHTGDPIGRAYPKPDGELDVAEALSRQPLKWTLGHWKKNAREVTRSKPSAAMSKQRFDDIKDELRRAQLAMQAQKKTNP